MRYRERVPTEKRPDPDVCECGRIKAFHIDSALTRGEEAKQIADKDGIDTPRWDYMTDTVKSPTNAYGELQFEGHNECIAKVHLI